PPPPHPPLFPYTTLFRSHLGYRIGHSASEGEKSTNSESGGGTRYRRARSRNRESQGPFGGHRLRPTIAAGSAATRVGALGAQQGDRKSTRLNSSHVKISY